MFRGAVGANQHEPDGLCLADAERMEPHACGHGDRADIQRGVGGYAGDAGDWAHQPTDQGSAGRGVELSIMNDGMKSCAVLVTSFFFPYIFPFFHLFRLVFTMALGWVCLGTYHTYITFSVFELIDHEELS